MYPVSHRYPQFKSIPGKPPDGTGEAPSSGAGQAATRGKRGILCAHCLSPVSGRDQILEVQGSHKHVFANPQGIVFEIGCFGSALCAYAGRPTNEFTWFRGYSWRFAACANCLTHLGWLFSSSGGHRFHGLILARLIYPDDDA